MILIALGLALLAAGAVLRLSGGPPEASAAQAQLCRDKMKDTGADMIARCDQAAFAAQTTATDAGSAARAISAANTSEIAGNALAMGLIGLGVALLVGGVVLSRQRR
ncbi:hypothetical protein [Sphingomonas sp. NFR15]|uniref:hypothetical protein n=2 Tax=Sphingomonas TaxID=13687 RepID=UPI00210D7887|nr:hypothetical protein [Sphingomonas sp. NFR15]